MLIRKLRINRGNTGFKTIYVPTTRALTVTRYAPSVTAAVALQITVPTRALVIVRYAPTATGPAPQLVTPTTKALTVTRRVPTATVSGHQLLTVGLKALTLTRYAPSALPSVAITVPTKTVTITRYAPTVNVGSGFYVDSAAAGGGAGTFASPWNSYAQWSTAAAGSTIIFRGGATEGAPKVYNSGGTLTAKNFHLKNYTDEHVQFKDQARTTLLVFSLWTGGSVMVQGTGSIKFGPCQSANMTDSSWGSSFALGLSGCRNMVLDGGASTKLIFASDSDFGLKVESSGTTGSKYLTIRYVEATGNGSGIYMQNSSNATRTPGPTGEGIVVEYCSLHDNKRMLDNRGTADVGAQGIGLARIWGTAANPFELRYCTIYNNHAASPQYGEDGIAFETYGAGYLNIHHNTVHDCAGWFETGTDQTSPLSSNINIHHNAFYGQTNGLSATSGSPGILLRDFSDSTFDHNTLDQGPNPTDAYILMLYDDSGTYGGDILRVKIRNNVFFHRDAKVIYYLANIPAAPNGPTIDYNIVRRSDANTSGIADYVGQSPTFRSWAQWQAHGFDTHGQTVDPGWTNGAAHVYTLAGGSAAIDAGVVIAGYSYNGSAPDVGAYES